MTAPLTLPEFASPHLPDWLETAAAGDLDALPFGLISMTPDGIVQHYSLGESRLSGLTPGRVAGRNFFTSVALCTNNFMVAHRFEVEPAIDAIIDYVFTFWLVPMKVRLRLLKRPDARHIHLAVEKRD